MQGEKYMDEAIKYLTTRYPGLTSGLPVVNIAGLKPGIYYVSVAGKNGEVVTTIPFVH